MHSVRRWFRPLRIGIVLVVALVGISLSCKTPPKSSVGMVEGKVDGNWPNTSSRVAYGGFWALGGDTAVDAHGNFQVPDTVAVVTAYMDANHNGAFDRFVEPSGACQHNEQGWRCAIANHRATLHRAVSVRDGSRHDSTYVFWEAYHPDGSWDPNSKICIADQCTTLHPGPFLSESNALVNELSICGEEGFAPTNAEIHYLNETSSVPVSQPLDLVASIKTTFDKDALRLTIASPAVERILIWGGVSDKLGEIQKVYWHSEQSANHIVIQRTPTGFDVEVPQTSVDICRQDHECVIAVQLLKYWDSVDEHVVSTTEFRTIVDFRSAP